MAGLFEKDMVAAAGPATVSEKLGVAFWLSFMWIILLAILAWGAEWLPLPEFDRMDWTHPAAPPGARSETLNRLYAFGTDTMGRDILSRLIFGARISLAVGLVTPLIGLVVGGLLGMLAGFYRGRIEAVIVVIMDVVLAFPGLVLLLAITFYLGPELKNIIAALGFLTIPSFCRVARANTLTFAEREFVQAARMLGQRDVSILFREILPNVIVPLLVYSLLVVSYMIVAEGALSFLGLSVPAPAPSWGGMILEGREVLEQAPHVSLIPALVLFLTVLSFNLMGDALRGLLDSREGRP